MMSRQEVRRRRGVGGDAFAKKHLDYVEFSAEDASRSDPDYLVEVFAEVIEAGARDAQRPRHHRLRPARGVRRRSSATLRERMPGGDRVIWSAHCHNDLGMAVANSLAAVQNGARQIECTINGIGERAGNTSMEEVVMAIKTRARPLRRRHRHRHRADLPDQPAASRRSPASRSRSTSRSSATTPSRTRPASTRTACSSTARTTRSCARRRSGWRRTGWCSASTPAATRFVDAPARARPRHRPTST